MNSPSSIPVVTLDEQAKPSRFGFGLAYWDPGETGPCSLLCADRSLSGVNEWLGSDGLSTVYRLIPWYPFPGRNGSAFRRRRDLLAPVLAGTHRPVVRVDPARPGTLSLAVSLTSPVLDHPDGPDAIDDGPACMWREAIVPVGSGTCAAVTVGVPEPVPLATGGRVVWAYPPAGMTDEAMAADMTILVMLQDCFESLRDRFSARLDVPGLKFSVTELERRLALTLLPLVAAGLGDWTDLATSPWPAVALCGVPGLSRAAGGGVATDGDAAGRLCIAQARKLRDRFPFIALPMLVRERFVADGHCAGEGTPCLPGTPAGDAAPCGTLPDEADLIGIFAPDPAGALPAPGGTGPGDGRSGPATVRTRLQSMLQRMHSFLSALSEVRRCRVAGTPATWRFGRSTMQIARRFGLLIDPREARAGRNADGGSPESGIVPLAVDVMGRTVAFARRAGRGFLLVVPADFGDETVRSLARYAEARLGVGRPGHEVLAAGPGDGAMAPGSGGPPAAVPAPGVTPVQSGSILDPAPRPVPPPRPQPLQTGPPSFFIEVNRRSCIVRDTVTQAEMGVVTHAESGLCDQRSPDRPSLAGRVLCSLHEHPTAGLTLDHWNTSQYHPAHHDSDTPGGRTGAVAFRQAITALRRSLKKVLAAAGVTPSAEAGAAYAEIITCGQPYRLQLNVRVLEEFLKASADSSYPAAAGRHGR